MKKLILLSLILATTGCSYIYGNKGVIKNREIAYLNARSIAPMEVPAGLSSSKIETHYPVSEKSFPESEKRVSLVPPDMQS